jgi:hypothetical protein
LAGKKKKKKIVRRHILYVNIVQYSEAQGTKWQYEACDPKWHSVAWGSKCELNHSIVVTARSG